MLTMFTTDTGTLDTLKAWLYLDWCLDHIGYKIVDSDSSSKN